MRLFYSPFSSNSRRACMTAAHLGTNVELALVDLGKGEQRKPEYLRINPMGKVPALEDDGFYLTESHAIMQYLCDKTPGQTIYPTELRARADVNRWLFWSAYHWQPAIAIFGWENRIKPLLGLGPADPKELQRGDELFSGCARVLDAHLADKKWVSGNDLTLADFALASALMVTESAKVPVGGFDNIRNWQKRVEALDVWKKTDA